MRLLVANKLFRLQNLNLNQKININSIWQFKINYISSQMSRRNFLSDSTENKTIKTKIAEYVGTILTKCSCYAYFDVQWRHTLVSGAILLWKRLLKRTLFAI